MQVLIQHGSSKLTDQLTMCETVCAVMRTTSGVNPGMCALPCVPAAMHGALLWWRRRNGASD